MNGDREEARAKMPEAELDWIARRWGQPLMACIAWSVYGENMPIGNAEWFHGIGYGLLTPEGADAPYVTLENLRLLLWERPQASPPGAHTLEELAILEDLRDKRIDSLAQTALAHGF